MVPPSWIELPSVYPSPFVQGPREEATVNWTDDTAKS